MTTRIGINGFGRMGRLALRAAWDWPDFDFVHINDPKADSHVSAHLLNFDSVHGRWKHEALAKPGVVTIGDSEIAVTGHATPADIPWRASGVDIVLECSGKFKTAAQLAPHFEQGAKKVIVAAPVKEDALNVVMGVNDHLYDASTNRLLTAASCTTNCLAPVVKVIHEGIGIRHGVITTIHDITNTQTVIDAPHKVSGAREPAACL